MTTRQVLIAAVIIAVVCCAVMWLLEDFRQARMIADFRAELDRLPSTLRGDTPGG